MGIVGADGPKALIFASPEGALKAPPEAIALPAEATALALGLLDGDWFMDLAIAAGDDLLIVHGRNYKKWSPTDVAPQPAVEKHHLSFPISSMAIGDFIPDSAHRVDIALSANDGTVHLLNNSGGKWQDVAQTSVNSVNQESQTSRVGYKLISARVSSGPNDDLLVLDPDGRQIEILTSDTEARSRGDAARFSASRSPMFLRLWKWKMRRRLCSQCDSTVTRSAIL